MGEECRPEILVEALHLKFLSLGHPLFLSFGHIFVVSFVLRQTWPSNAPFGVVLVISSTAWILGSNYETKGAPLHGDCRLLYP